MTVLRTRVKLDGAVMEVRTRQVGNTPGWGSSCSRYLVVPEDSGVNHLRLIDWSDSEFLGAADLHRAATDPQSCARALLRHQQARKDKPT